MALTPAQKQKAYRDRKRAIKMAPIIEARRAAEELARAKEEVERLEHEAAEQAAQRAAEALRKAEEAALARRGELSPDGDPWRPGEPVTRPNTQTSARAMMEAGRRAALQQAVDSFDKTGALAPDPDGPRRRVESPYQGRIRYDWHRDY